jgi:ABC-2 type transport system ATP-binding protein
LHWPTLSLPGPELLLLDEPTSGLDPLVQETFHELVHEAVAEGRTVFLSSHVLDEVEHLCHTVAVIRDGRIVAVEDITQLRTRAGRKVTIRFADPIDPTAFAAAGVTDLVVHDRSVSMRVRGELDLIVKAAARHHIIDLVSTPPDLEEIFLGYYQEGGGEGHHHG